MPTVAIRLDHEARTAHLANQPFLDAEPTHQLGWGEVALTIAVLEREGYTVTTAFDHLAPAAVSLPPAGDDAVQLRYLDGDEQWRLHRDPEGATSFSRGYANGVALYLSRAGLAVEIMQGRRILAVFAAHDPLFARDEDAGIAATLAQFHVLGAALGRG